MRFGRLNAAALRRRARALKDSGQARRLLALAKIYDGGSRSEAAEVGGVTLQSVRDWVVWFNRDGLDGLISIKPQGSGPKLDAEQREALKAIVETGPIPAVDGGVRWRLIDLVQWISDTFGVSLDETTVGRMLRSMGLRKLTARPRHNAQNEFAAEALKKTSRKKSKRSVPASSRG